MNIGIVDGGDPAFGRAWQGLGGRQVARSALYQPSSLAFYRELRQAEQVADLSFVVTSSERALAGVSMQAFRRTGGGVEVTCHGLPILYGEAEGLSAAERDAASRQFKTAISQRLAPLGEIEELVFRDHLEHGALSPFGRLLLAHGAQGRPAFTQAIELAASEADLKAPFSKTVRWSINWGLRNLALELRDADTVLEGDIEAFRQLHISAAGRETRSIATWARQLDMIRAGDAFVVLGRLQDELVTAALFITSAQHCYYGVSASRRELFDKPLGHAVIWTAIQHAKGLGVDLFELGDPVYSSSSGEPPTTKEQGIGFFKRSFGGLAEVSLDIRLSGGWFGEAG